MKKMIAVLLSVLMLCGMCSVAAFAADQELSLTVVTDVHHSRMLTTQPITKSTEDDPFGHVVSNGKMTAESAAIVDEFFKQAAANDSQYVIVTGDISDYGTPDDAAAIAAKLEAFEASSGKTVLCVIGNHDLMYMDVQGFKSAYANLGYDKALAVDDASASYTADLNDTYRLIAIDSNNVNQALVDWIDAQVQQAKADGKKLISVTHFSLFSHYTVQQLVHTSVIDKQWNLPDKFIDWGIKFNFSGHTHELDIGEYANDKGTVYDIVSGALTTYPACFRTAKFGKDGVKIDTKYIRTVDSSLIPEGMNGTAADLLQSDFRAYAKKMFTQGSYRQLTLFLTPAYVKAVAKLDAEQDADIIAMLDVVMPRLAEAVTMPLYAPETEEGEEAPISLEAIAAQYGFTIPETEYKDMLEIGCEIYAAHCAGDENYPMYSTVGQAASNGLGAALNYALEPLSEEDYNKLLDWALTKVTLPFAVPDALKQLTAETVSKSQGIEYILMYAVSPIINDFTKDPAPSDVSVTLPNYGYEDNDAASFLKKIRKYFEMILAFLHALFSFLYG